MIFRPATFYVCDSTKLRRPTKLKEGTFTEDLVVAARSARASANLCSLESPICIQVCFLRRLHPNPNRMARSRSVEGSSCHVIDPCCSEVSCNPQHLKCGDMDATLGDSSVPKHHSSFDASLGHTSQQSLLF
eukprot:GHVO01048793.1.p1 GENE.GHVO01048793.1~~GHVO01048793.1.p1  ORF type:complete len:132 (-),score=0.52 GHVO01048793.1:194-589(-)